MKGKCTICTKDDVDAAPADFLLGMDRFVETTILELLHQTVGSATVTKEVIDTMVRIFTKGFNCSITILD